MNTKIKVAEFYLDFANDILDASLVILKSRQELNGYYDRIYTNENQEEIDKMNKSIKREKKELNQYLLNNVPVKCRPYVEEAILKASRNSEELQKQLLEQKLMLEQKINEQEQELKKQEQELKKQEQIITENKLGFEQELKKQDQKIEELVDKINSFER